MKSMEFWCVGFDVRQWPWGGALGADDTVWDQNGQRYAELANTFGLYRNEYQLLEVEPPMLNQIKAAVHSWADCNLVAVEYPCDLIRLRNSRLGFNTASQEHDLGGFICRGLDVCDLNCLISVLGHPSVENRRGGVKLFEERDLAPALELVQLANVLDPSHAPFAVAKVWSLK